jgi:hypothetical protein
MTNVSRDEMLALAEQIYGVLSDFPSDGQLRSDAQREVMPHLIGAHFIERREIDKACKCCGRMQFSYAYFKITMGGKLFMAAMERATKESKDATG